MVFSMGNNLPDKGMVYRKYKWKYEIWRCRL